MQHLSYEEIERFLEEDDFLEENAFSEEYLLWLDKIMEHLDGCLVCQRRIGQARKIFAVCKEEYTVAAIGLLKNEQMLRMQYVAQKLGRLYQETRMQEVAERLKNGGMLSMLLFKEDFVRRQSATRGMAEKDSVKKIQLSYENGRIVIQIPCKKEEKVTVVFVRKDDVMTEPKVMEAVWSETEHTAVVEFLEEKLEEAYEVYIDIQ